MVPKRFVQTRPPPREPFHHGPDTAPLTIARKTTIRMPELGSESSFTALFILEDEISVETINDFLSQINIESGVFNLWLADNDLMGLTENEDDATVPPVDPAWRSPFVGSTVEDAFEYLATISLEKSLNRNHIVVLSKQLYERNEWIIIYKIDEKGEITAVPCDAAMTTVYVDSYSQHLWPRYFEDWQNKGKPIFSSRDRLHKPSLT